MWWDWPDRVDIYLGRGLVLIRSVGLPVKRFEPPLTLPLSDILDQVDREMGRSASRPWNLRVYLSATFCSPVTFSLPDGVEGQREPEAIAKATAASAKGLPEDRSGELVCALDHSQAGLAAVMMAGTYDQIMSWARKHRGRLLSLSPLWAVATTAPLARRELEQARSVALLESDAATLLIQAEEGRIRAVTWPGRHTIGQLKDRMDAALRVMMTSMRSPGLLEGEDVGSVVLEFGEYSEESGHARIWSGSGLFRDHWKVLS